MFWYWSQWMWRWDFCSRGVSACVLLLRRVWLFAAPWTVAHQAPLSMGWAWVAMPSSRGSSQPRNGTQLSCIASGFFTSWATRKAQESWSGEPTSSPGIELGPLHYRWILYQLSYLGSPKHVYMCLDTHGKPKICICKYTYMYVLILSIWLDHRVPRYWANILMCLGVFPNEVSTWLMDSGKCFSLRNMYEHHPVHWMPE